MADFGVGNRGTLRVTDDGSTVSFYVLCSDPATFDYAYDWFGTVNGVGVGGTVSLGKGFGIRHLGSWYVGSSQYVTIGQQATGTQGLGGAASFSVYIGRATIPPAPIPVAISQVTADSFRHQFSGVGDGGSAITQWEIQLATNPSFSPVLRVGINGPYNGIVDNAALENHTQYWIRARGWNSAGGGYWSSASTATTLGHPTAPLGLSATPSTSVTGRVSLSWTAPTTTGVGGIVGYNIFRNGTQVATTTGTATSYIDTGLTPYTSYTYTVAARNNYSTSVSGTSPQSSSAAAIAPGPPSAPRTLASEADDAVPGKVDLSWVAPVNTGAGGITGYRIYFAGGALIAQTTGTGTTYSVTGLNPGTTYSFQVFARNALAAAEGTMSVGSNTTSVTPIGEPGAPTNVTLTQSVTTSNRLVLSWTPPPGTLSGYSVFSQTGGVDTLIQKIKPVHTSFAIDPLPAGSPRTYVVRARTAYTDTLSAGYPGNWGGPESAPVTASASNDARQTVPSLNSAISATNAIFNGQYTITGVTSNTTSYSKLADSILPVASGGTIANDTNAVYNGTFTIASSPAPNSLTYAKTADNIGQLNVFGGSVTDSTNTSMNVTNVQVTAVNSGAHTLSYTKNGTNVATVAVPVNVPPGGRGLVTNLTNASFNVTGKVITAATKYTIKYAQTGTNVAENNAAGTVTDTSNTDVFNGFYSVLSTPDHRTLTYTTVANTEAAGARVWEDPSGTVERSTSKATLNVRYRSGWIG